MTLQGREVIWLHYIDSIPLATRLEVIVFVSLYSSTYLIWQYSSAAGLAVPIEQHIPQMLRYL